jgi:hypothetical protein
LFDFTAEHASQGDIGKWTNGAIARACDWDGDPDHFVNSLVASGWVDEKTGWRLLVHDWPDHCESWVKAKLAKLDLGFAATTEPTREPSAEATAETTTEPSSFLNPPSLNPTKPKTPPTPPAGRLPPELDSQEFQEAWTEWEAHRKHKRAKLTPETIRRQYKKLASMGMERAIAAIGHSIEKGWTGIYEPSDNGVPKKKPSADELLAKLHALDQRKAAENEHD